MNNIEKVVYKSNKIFPINSKINLIKPNNKINLTKPINNKQHKI
jgi:hypothetical protein